MTWPVIAGLLVQYGIPLTDKLIAKWLSGEPLTAESWAEIRGMASETAVDRAKAVLALKGIPLDSEIAKTIIALAS